MKYFRVKYGYGKNEFISVDELNLAKAIYSMTMGTIFSTDDGVISGKSILSILPDYQRHLGLNKDWEITGEDLSLISSEVKRKYISTIKECTEKVTQRLPNNSKLLT